MLVDDPGVKGLGFSRELSTVAAFTRRLWGFLEPWSSDDDEARKHSGYSKIFRVPAMFGWLLRVCPSPR